MFFWIFMFVCSLFLPLLMTIMGAVMRRNCPKEINQWVGYRTRRSMVNMDTWKFAHEYCGRLWWKLGLGMLVLTVLAQLPFLHASQDAVGILGLAISALQCICLAATIFPTERALEKNFTEDGARR